MFIRGERAEVGFLRFGASYLSRRVGNLGPVACPSTPRNGKSPRGAGDGDGAARGGDPRGMGRLVGEKEEEGNGRET